MFSQADIDAVLSDAQEAVDALAGDVGQLVQQTATNGISPATEPAQPPAVAASATRPLDVSPERIRRILRLKVPVVVRLAERPMLLSEIMKMVPGTIFEFSRTVDQELDLLVNNHQIGGGVAVRVNERFGLRVTQIGDMRGRINSLTAP
jgi:flagellar motor switch/type III secretory pathway protein FliN